MTHPTTRTTRKTIKSTKTPKTSKATAEAAGPYVVGDRGWRRVVGAPVISWRQSKPPFAPAGTALAAPVCVAYWARARDYSGDAAFVLPDGTLDASPNECRIVPASMVAEIEAVRADIEATETHLAELKAKEQALLHKAAKKGRRVVVEVPPMPAEMAEWVRANTKAGR